MDALLTLTGVSTSELQEKVKIPYFQINQVDRDYTGVLGFCGVILFLGIVGYIIAWYWINKYFKHKQQIDQARLKNECTTNSELNKKLDNLLKIQKDLVEGIKKCN